MADSISQAYKPNYKSPAYNPIIYSVLSAYYSNLNFYYTFDVYVDDDTTRIARYKQRPNPSGYGMLDISSLVQSYIEYDNENAPITNGELTIDFNSGQVYCDNDYLSRKFTVKVGVQFDSSTTGVTYYEDNNNVLTPDTPPDGWPSTILYSGNTTNTKLPVMAFNCALDPISEKYHIQSTTGAGIFSANPYLQDSDGNPKRFDHGFGLAYPLSIEKSMNRDVYAFDKLMLTYMNYTINEAQKDRVIYGFRYRFKNASGTILSTQDVPITATVGGSQRLTSTSSFSDTFDPDLFLIHVLASPNDLISAFGLGASITLAEGYTIEITGYNHGAEGTSTFTSACTETLTLTIKDYCSDPLYDRVRLSWLNELGGRDYLNFTAMNVKKVDVKEETYFKDKLNWAGTTPIESFGSQPLGLDTIRGGMRDYDKQAMGSYIIESDWLTQDQVDLLEGLVKSPQVLAYIHDENNSVSDYFPYLVKIKQKSYETKNVRQEKLVQGKFTIELTLPQKMQNM